MSLPTAAGPPASPDYTPTLPPIPAATAAPGVDGVCVPGYEVLGELGRGGMGVVYRARQVAAGRVVALKMILGGSHAGEGELLRFRTEAEAIARLQHPHIVQVYEVGQHQGLPFFSLEYCGGGTLDKKLAGTPLPPGEAARLVETLARAVQAAHDRQVIHRDLKPANVLLTEDGTPKVTDFGLAKKLDKAGQTQSGSILGTPSYMAPEQAGGRRQDVGPAADVYALGAILYECLTGRPPFKAATPLDTVLQVLSEEPVPPRRLQGKTPRDLETITLKCLQKDPRKRYASARELAEDLRRFTAGEPIRARPAAWWERGAKWVRRRPAVAGLLAACAAAVLTLAAGGWQYGVERNRHARVLEAALEEAQQQRQAARKEHDRAQAHLNKALQAVDRLLQPLNDGRLAPVPQLQEPRRQMLESALDFYRGFLAQEGSDPGVRRDAARGYFRSALLHLWLGQTDEAEREAAEALALQKALVADFPERPEYRYDLARTHGALGHVCSLNLRGDGASEAYRQELELSDSLVAEYPGEAAYREALIDAHRNLGMLGVAKDPAPAEKHLRQAVEQAELLVQKHPSSPERECLLASAHAHLGQVLFVQNRVAEAAAELDRAWARLGPKDGKPPRSAAEYPATRALVLAYRGGSALRQGQLKEAEPLLRDGVAAYEQLVELAPQFFPHRLQLVQALTYQAMLYEKTGRPVLAEASWQKAVDAGEQTARALPALPWLAALADNPRVQRWLLGVGRGEYAPIMAEVRRQAARPNLQGPYAYNLACVSAQAAAAARSDERVPSAERAARVEEYARGAMALLARAQTAGYFHQPGALAHTRTDSDLDPLRQREDFRQWLSRLEQAAAP
jgi:tetratricopeptide (TPR) repeat protein